jgi:hypothetical protein
LDGGNDHELGNELFSGATNFLPHKKEGENYQSEHKAFHFQQFLPRDHPELSIQEDMAQSD